MKYLRHVRASRGFTLIETLIAVTIFAIIATSAWIGLANIFQANNVLRARTAAANLATEQIEIIRNLPYEDVGIENAIPDGIVPRTQMLTRDNYEFEVTTTIRNVDHEFDGTIGGTPNDLSPADAKLVEVHVSCDSCGTDFREVTYSTWVSPLGLETTGDNGALFISVFDANGQPVSGASVHIENNQVSPAVVIDDVTNALGELQIIDAYPGTNAYEIFVTKSGYSSEQTYPIGASENPVPDKPHANIVSGQVTEISFSIDELSTIDLKTQTITCDPYSSVSLAIAGEKTIGYDTLKYDETITTNGSGLRTLSNMEWDTYSILPTGSSLDLRGINPVIPFNLNPGTEQDVEILLGSSNPRAVLMKVIDGSNEQLLSDALVTITGAQTMVATTGSGYIEQVDWSGGAGQEVFTNETRYLSDNGDIETNNPASELRLDTFGSGYDPGGFLLSSTFDVGTTTNFLALDWNPADQPLQAGDESVRFQIATNESLEEPLTWSYLGPDGTSASYYTEPGQAINPLHDGDRYLRYRVFLSTDDTTYTPNISRVWFTFSNNCTPIGQVYFGGLGTGQYDVQIEKEGYGTVVLEDQVFAEDWQLLEVLLNPGP